MKWNWAQLSFMRTQDGYATNADAACLALLQRINFDETESCTLTIPLPHTLDTHTVKLVFDDPTTVVCKLPQINCVFKLKLLNGYADCNNNQLLSAIKKINMCVRTVQSSATVARHMAKQHSYIPNHVMFMEQCAVDVWNMQPTTKTDKMLMSYLRFVVQFLRDVTYSGCECRNFKSKNNGVFASNGSQGVTYKILDVTQILPVHKATSAVCTFPATVSYTFGNNSFVGMAATAWAMIADFFTLIGYDIEKLSHENIGKMEQTQPAHCYASPKMYVNVYAHVQRESVKKKFPRVSFVLQQALLLHRAHFPNGCFPASAAQATHHGFSFFCAMQHVLCAAELQHGPS